MPSHFSGIHLFSRKDSRIKYFFFSSFFLTDFLSLLYCKIDFCLPNVFMGMRAFQWKYYKSFTHIRHLGEKWGCFYSAHFSQRAAPPAIFLISNFRMSLFEAWVCEFQRKLCRLLKFAWFEEKEQWQLIDTGMAKEARLNQKHWFQWNPLLCCVLACHQWDHISKCFPRY